MSIKETWRWFACEGYPPPRGVADPIPPPVWRPQGLHTASGMATARAHPTLLFLPRHYYDSVGELRALAAPHPAGAINRAPTHSISLRSSFLGNSPTESTIHGLGGPNVV